MFSFVDEKNMSYSVSHLKTKQEIRSWKELSAPPKKNSVLSVLLSVEKKKTTGHVGCKGVMVNS